jgi:hypothetical protein
LPERRATSRISGGKGEQSKGSYCWVKEEKKREREKKGRNEMDDGYYESK